MKKNTKIGIGVLVGALVLAITDDICRRIDLSYMRYDRDWWKDEWEKEMKCRVNWWSIARQYRYYRDNGYVKSIDKKFDDMMEREYDTNQD